MKMTIRKYLWLQLVLVGLVFAVLYSKAISKLISDWSVDPNFSHGFLIPFVSLYMIWHKKYELSELPKNSEKTGIIVILFGMLVHVLGNVGAELFLMRFSMVITLAGMVIYFYGYAVFKKCLIPILYLILMIPIPSILWNKIAFPLQLFAAKVSAQMIDFIGIPVFREGNILHLSNTSLEVVDACSGIRSLTSLLALTGIFAFIAQFSHFKKWVLFLSAIPIAVIVNVIRLTITGAMAAWIGPETAHGFLHDASGFIIFGAALAMVYCLYLIGMKLENKKVN